MEIDCVSLDNHKTNTELTSSGNYDELQSWWTTVDQLETQMQELEVMKTRLQQDSAARQQPQLEWQLSITNGVLRLETPIRNVEELAQFSKASMRYLSPFTGFFTRQPIRFESQSISLTLGLTAAMQRHDMLKPRRRQLALLDYNDSSQHSTQISRSTIDHLVSIYLRHYNSIYGAVHQPTFLQHYHSMDDPMNSALTLGVCVDAIVRVHHQLNYSANKLCLLGKLFYNRCKDLLFDLYEDPRQKLKVVIVTSLLSQYLIIMHLNYIEANHLVTMALRVCPDLIRCHGGTTPVERVLFQRHYLHLEMLSRVLKMLHEEKVDFTKPTGIEVMEALDDEPEKTKVYMAMSNHIFRLLGSPYVSDMMRRINNIFQGLPCDILLEDILQYEPLIKEWWSSLPEQYRVCEDPFDHDVYKLVEVKVSENYFPFFILHIMTGVFASSILQPNVTSTAEGTVPMEAMQLIRDKSASLALSSCKVLIHALDQNWDPKTSDMPSFSLTVMLYVTYCLEKISYSKVIRFPLYLLNKMMKSLATRINAFFPPGHAVPSSSSLLTSLLTNNKSIYDIYETYDSYLFPGCALTSDQLFTSVNRLVDQHLRVSSHQ
ncbi:hypothetical protein BJV82DRAFT_606934 [Fennellomyces sp. T-0311]|nr:hypothetical protein BJV82DRAFT_606934 [Fennellomyces sp. T-0311]